MSHQLVQLFISDLSGISRGKTITVEEAPHVVKKGVGWIPSNAYITCFGDLTPVENDALGELRLLPVSDSYISLEKEISGINAGFWTGRVQKLDGSPWEFCLRNHLQDAVTQLQEDYGIALKIGLEQEFYLLNQRKERLNAYTVDSFFESAEFLECYADCLLSAGIAVKSLHAENGPAQYELTLKPLPPDLAADQLVLAKEIGKICARASQEKITYSPVISANKVGSGLHIHFSLLDTHGNNINSEEGLVIGKKAGSFVSGILEHLPSLLAFTSPSVISPERYQPPRWTAYFNNLGIQDRKAAVRVTKMGEEMHGIHFELRTADATASPYLILSSLIYAGIDGLVRKLPPPSSQSTQDLLDQKEFSGVSRLPDSLEKSLSNLMNNKALLSYYPQEFIEAYLTNKEYEITLASKLKGQDLYNAYMNCY